MVTRDGGIPLTWYAYPGDRPDVTQFPAMIDQLRGRYQAVTAAAGVPAAAAEMTVVFDAGQNSEDNFAYLAGAGLHYIGSVPASDCPDLTSLPASVRAVVDQDRFGGLTAYESRREVYGADRRAILTHSPELRRAQARGFNGTTLAKAGRKLGRAGRHPGPRQDPPPARQGRSRDRRDHPSALGPARRHLAAVRRAAQGPAPIVASPTRRPAPRSKKNSSASTC